MMDIFEPEIFPFHLPQARELEMLLVETIPSAEGIRYIADRVKFPLYQVPLTIAPLYIWHEILSLGAKIGTNRALVEQVLEDFPRHPRADFLRHLLRPGDGPVEVEARFLGGPGSAGFLAGDSTIQRPEALLFHDDLTLEIGRLPGLIATLGRMHEVRSGVCRLRVTHKNMSLANGTGFLVGPGLVMTNWHVVNTGEERCLLVEATFGFEDDGAGGTCAATRILGRVETIAGSAEDDWAVFELKREPEGSCFVFALDDPGEAELGEAAFIIQHPGKETKRIAYVRNQITHVDERVVHYLSDTQGGSSGSPVMDARGRLIALHRAGGDPQEVAGRPPMRKNEGVNIRRVAAGLEQHRMARAPKQ